MNVFEAVRTRRSIRKYEDKPVEKEKLMQVLEAARLSASANNNQPCEYIVITEKNVKEALLPAYGRLWFSKAPAIIVACSNPEKAWSRQDGEDFWKVDTAISVQNMILVAHELGLGTCWISAFDEGKTKEVLQIPKEQRVIAMITLGYPMETKEPVTQRKPMEELVHYENW